MKGAALRKLAIRIAAGGLLVVIVLGLSLAYLLRHPTPKLKGMPDELRVARIMSGGDRFSKNALYRDPYLDVITDIKNGRENDLVVVGLRGAAFVSEHGSLQRSIHFERCGSNVTAVDLEGVAFLCRGAWAMETMLFDPDGKTLWSYNGGADAIDDAAAGILGPGDSRRVVVGFNGSGGVRLLTAEGKELWKREDGNVWHVEIATADNEANEANKVILHSNTEGQLTIRDANGNVIARYRPEILLTQFSLTAWNGDLRRNKLITAREGFVYVNIYGGKDDRAPASSGQCGLG